MILAVMFTTSGVPVSTGVIGGSEGRRRTFHRFHHANSPRRTRPAHERLVFIHSRAQDNHTLERFPGTRTSSDTNPVTMPPKRAKPRAKRAPKQSTAIPAADDGTPPIESKPKSPPIGVMRLTQQEPSGKSHSAKPPQPTQSPDSAHNTTTPTEPPQLSQV